MRISDWSSDVCSSDLRLDQLFQLRALRLVALRIPFAKRFEMLAQPRDRIAERPGARFLRGAIGARIVRGTVPFGAIGEMLDQRRAVVCPRPIGRSDERRVGKECGSTCRSRGTPYH